jgi:hypothetical protein
MQIQSRGNVPPVESTSSVILYDRKSGDIVHIHRVVNFKGAVVPAREAVEQEARTLAERFGKSVQELDTLHYDDVDFMQSEKEYRVDLSSRTLIESGLKRSPDLDTGHSRGGSGKPQNN